MNLENVPNELKQLPNWVLWRSEQNGNGNPSKVPYSPITGNRASSTTPEQWGTFDQTVQLWQAYGFDGIGFMFGNSPYAGVDLDKTTNEEVKLFHNQVATHLNSYTETSPSGLGRHIIVKGSVPKGCKISSKAIEIYSDSRYFTFTGNGSGIIEQRADELRTLWDFVSGDTAEVSSNVESKIVEQTESDTGIFTQASVATNGDKFTALWNGQTSAHANDHSAADQALMNILAFYTQNTDQLKRLFRASGLGQRKKAWREDYLDRTIKKAFDQMIPTVEFKWRPQEVSQAVATTVEVNAIASTLTCPNGLVGEIAKFIYAQAPIPSEQIAIAGAIGFMAGICSRSFSISNKGLNQYIVLLAKTGRGKEAMASGISRLVGAVAQLEPAASAFLGPGRIASGPALLKRLSGPIPSFVSVMGEFGHWMQEICSPRAGQNEKKLREIILDVYGKSGPTDVLQPLIYSDSTKNTQGVRAPGFSILGESTPHEFYAAVDESSIALGLLPRLLVIDYCGLRAPFNESHQQAEINPNLLSRLSELISYSLKLNQQHKSIPVALAPDLIERDREFRTYCDSRVNSEQSDTLIELWNRVHLKVIKLAALLTVGINPYQPVIQRNEYEWAVDLVVQGVRSIVERFETGEVGSPVNATRQDSDIRETIRYYFSEEFTERMGGYKINPDARSGGYIPLHFIRTRLRRVTSFRNDRYTNLSIEKAIKSLIDEGYLTAVQVKGDNAQTATYYRLGRTI